MAYDILGITDNTLREPQQELTVKATKEDGSVITFQATARLDTPIEVNCCKNGGTAKRADGVEEAGAGRVICAANCTRDIMPLTVG